MQSGRDELPTDALEFVGQSLHTVDPEVSLYFPATHCEQGPPRGPVEPVLQLQLVEKELPDGEEENGVHDTHV